MNYQNMTKKQIKAIIKQYKSGVSLGLNDLFFITKEANSNYYGITVVKDGEEPARRA